MLATAILNQYALTVTDYTAGTHNFTVRATDDGSPALTTTSETLSVIVVVPPAVESSTRGTPNSVGQLYTPVAIRDAIPRALVGTVESAFKVADAAVKPIPPRVAKALPYTTISTLGGFAFAYTALATQQTRNRLRLKRIAERFKRTDASRKNYIDLTSHYLNTPVATMQTSLELFESQKSITAHDISLARKRLARLAKDVGELLGYSTQVNAETKQAAVAVAQASGTPLLKSAGFILPIIGVLLIALISNSLFIWSNKYQATIANISAQSGLYIFGALGLAATYSLFRRSQTAAAVANQELALEQTIANSQSEFIHRGSRKLADDLTGLHYIAGEVENIPHGKTFTSSLMSLESAVDKLAYLDSLTTPASTNAQPISVDISLKVIIDKYLPIAQAKDIALDVQADTGLRALIDEAGFRQIVGSLLDNAIKFTESKGKVVLNIRMKENKTIIKVKDTGIGIPHEKLEQLFTPFSRGTDTRAFNYQGMGIDLYMNKVITDRWGGAIHVDSVEKTGTTVTVTLDN